jgi:trans-aconitate methyltransferase
LTWDGAHYADHTAHHRAYDDVVRTRISGTPTDARILDVGCGVGDFTRSLVALVPEGSVTGVDADPSMIAHARAASTAQGSEGGSSTAPVPAFDVVRAQDLADKLPAASVDLMVSTACLHWLPREDHPMFLAGAFTVLAPGGRAVLEFGGHGQLADVREVLDPLARACGGKPPTWWFASDDQYRTLLLDAGFAVRDVALLRQVRALPDVETMRGWLTSQVLVGYRPHIPADAWPSFETAALTGVENLLRQPDGTCDVEYVRLVVDAART